MQTTYQCLDSHVFIDSLGYELVSIREKDIENIRLWRNAQLEFLRQNLPLSIEEQQRYFQVNIWPLFCEKHPNQILCSFLLHGECIGYGGLTHIDWEAKRSEISFLLNPMRIQEWTTYQKEFAHFLHLACQIAFRCIGLRRLFTETFAFRMEHIQLLEAFGFQKEGILREHVYKNNKWWNAILHGLLSWEWINEKY
jgi:RimJ/RimL family protein N-acetyltransferase